jgi:hypothetical protein
LKIDLPSTPDEDKERLPILVRAPKSKVEAFKELHPWHGALTQFWLQALDEFLELSKGQKTPSQMTTEAVRNVFRDGY